MIRKIEEAIVNFSITLAFFVLLPTCPVPLSFSLSHSLSVAISYLLISLRIYQIKDKVTASDTTSVTLVDVSRNLTGTYKCEVSAGVPSYHTLIERAKMMVVDAPKTDPTIGSEKERIAVGEMLRANCTSGASRPATAITWMLNGDHITNNSSQFWIQTYLISLEDGTVKTKSLIEFKITNDMFRNDRLHLRCIAFISDVYRKSADMEISIDEPLLASITGDAPARSHTESSASVVMNQELWYSATMTSIALATAILAMTEALTSGRLTNAVLGTR
ncbi:uncharacterized protein LOC124949310 isoform X6 [Vespa velutina]|uniref:uncharacterized protein LOC124949310 isoform X6 n=1 Tax=Vespa velutina TaxID=202808 RepID=UPI001FB562C4|nr:uncharacterized protein LOC124949310 isoform X6 [Vespa velutina]